MKKLFLILLADVVYDAICCACVFEIGFKNAVYVWPL